jgi:phage-related tail protein
VGNEISKRIALEKRERQLHEQLATATRHLHAARVQLKLCEDALEHTLVELHEVKEQKKKITGLLESMWNGSSSNNSLERALRKN